MLLTGAALRDFIKFSSTGNGYIYLNQKMTTGIYFSNLIDSVLNSLIAEWFSTHTEVDIDYILSLALEEMKYVDALTESIKKANEIYNKQSK